VHEPNKGEEKSDNTGEKGALPGAMSLSSKQGTVSANTQMKDQFSEEKTAKGDVCRMGGVATDAVNM
jgi:hypothetical protein